MLAYLFWHRPYASVDAKQYEQSLLGFHRYLAEQPPPGFAGSCSYRIPAVPWLGDQAGYEDWYLVEGSWALDPLNSLAVTGRMEAPHTTVAAQMEVGHGGLYSLVWGAPDLPEHRAATWLKRPRGTQWRPVLESLRTEHPALACWRRQMVLGPAPEFVVIGSIEQKPGQPKDWMAQPVKGDRVGDGRNI